MMRLAAGSSIGGEGSVVVTAPVDGGGGGRGLALWVGGGG